MKDVWKYCKEQVQQLFEKWTEEAGFSVEPFPELGEPRDKTFGDFCSGVAFKIGTEQDLPKDVVAQKIMNKVTGHILIEKIVRNGCYINVFLDKGLFSELTIQAIQEGEK